MHLSMEPHKLKKWTNVQEKFINMHYAWCAAKNKRENFEINFTS